MEQQRIERKPNPSQLAFIEDDHPFILLHASAGTGKTYAISEKVRRALAQGIKGEEILCLTFTEKGAKEMKGDICATVEEPVGVYTIHGYCLRLLREVAKAAGDRYADHSVKDETDCMDFIVSDVAPSLLECVSDRLLYEKLHKGLHELRDFGPIAFHPLSGPVWRTENGYVDFFGNDISAEQADSLGKHTACPKCGAVRNPQNGRCPECAFDYRQTLPVGYLKCDFYAFISAIRHKRELFFPDGDDYSAFQRSVHEMAKSDEEGFHRLCAGRNRTMDRRVSSFWKQYGAQLTVSYLDRLEAVNAYDFDSLIIRAEHLLRRERPHIYKLLIVDEVQDTSELEYKIMTHLFAGAQVVLCGDPFQTIYEWRGAKPDRILADFRLRGAVSHHFEENYRSTKLLSLAGYGFLKNAFTERLTVPKTFYSHSKEEGEPIRVVRLSSDRSEAVYLHESLRQREGSVCLMTRSNRGVANLYRSLQKINQSLPESERLQFYTVEQDTGFYKHVEIKDFLAFLRILLDPADLISFERVILGYVGKVGEATLRKIKLVMPLGAFLQDATYTQGDPYAPIVRDDQQFVVYDLETTGLDRSKDQLLQIAAIRFNAKGEILDKLNELVIPTVPISEGALKTHQKTLAELTANGTADVRAVLEKFLAFVKGSYLFGHNSTAFDRAILRRQLTENGLPYPNVVAEGDTLLMAKECLPAERNYKLDTLCKRFDIVNEHAHDAFADVSATMKVFLSLRKQFLLPGTMERRAQVQLHIHRFARFHEAYRSWQEFLNEGQIAPIVTQIASIVASRKKYDGEEAQSRIKMLKDLLIGECERGESFLSAFLEATRQASVQLDGLLNRSASIPIVTVHQTKGCEYETVYLCQAEDDFFPNRISEMGGQLEEEKRLFYVALTRAKKRLVITYSAYRLTGGQAVSVKRSRFLDLIPEEYRLECDLSGEAD